MVEIVEVWLLGHSQLTHCTWFGNVRTTFHKSCRWWVGIKWRTTVSLKSYYHFQLRLSHGVKSTHVSPRSVVWNVYTSSYMLCQYHYGSLKPHSYKGANPKDSSVGEAASTLCTMKYATAVKLNYFSMLKPDPCWSCSVTYINVPDIAGSGTVRISPWSRKVAADLIQLLVIDPYLDTPRNIISDKRLFLKWVSRGPELSKRLPKI